MTQTAISAGVVGLLKQWGNKWKAANY